jgi:hypothetical protein
LLISVRGFLWLVHIVSNRRQKRRNIIRRPVRAFAFWTRDNGPAKLGGRAARHSGAAQWIDG